MNWLFSKISKELDEFYASRSVHDDSALKMGWKSREAQAVRFEQIAKVITHDADARFTLNDLGCGCGDLSEYLHTKGFKNLEYTGYDVSSAIIEEANRLYGGNSNRKFIQIDDSENLKQSNYTIASGIFNIRFSIPNHEWMYYVLESINRMFQKSDDGIAFNMLTIYSDKELMKPDLYYADPSFIFDYCKTNLSKNVALLHDYREYDFTVVVRKN